MILTEKELIQIRRHLHQIPELALKEFKTHDYLLNTTITSNCHFSISKR